MHSGDTLDLLALMERRVAEMEVFVEQHSATIRDLLARIAVLEARPVAPAPAAVEVKPAKKPDPIDEMAAKIAGYARARRTVVTTTVELRATLDLGADVAGCTIAAAIKRIAGGAFPGVTAAHTGETVLPNHGRAWLWTLTAAKAVAS